MKCKFRLYSIQARRRQEEEKKGQEEKEGNMREVSKGEGTSGKGNDEEERGHIGERVRQLLL